MGITLIAPLLAYVHHPASDVKYSKANPLHATTACERGHRMGSVVSVTPRPRYFRDPLNKRLGWPRPGLDALEKTELRAPTRTHFASSDVQLVA